MKQTELIYLIEDAEQGGDLQTIENGKAARVELDNMNKQLAALREAGEKMKAALEDIKLGNDLYGADIETANTALAEWEAANK